ncbi:MAG: hypothetical protein KAS63_08170 [Candidatus Heimdallarchaeota archaeon]|nr:hypothetical protein [Candidatus Heimdallarchaeota archaeon]MCK4955326.1 hypothetical protein [Candidatus Heimdallarchaeota archaeon]
MSENKLDADEISFSPDSVRKKQKLRTILTTIGESLQTVFKNHIYESIGERPSLISIDDVNSIEKGTSKSKVHFVTYYLNTDIGKQSVNLVVKFSADEVRYDKEIKNYSLISSVPSRFPGIYIPKIIYKSAQNRCIIYEGVTGTSFRETQLDKNFKHQLAGQTLSAIHGTDTGKFVIEPYKKLILYLLSIFSESSLEEEIIELMLPSFKALEKSFGGATIFGDYHQGNLMISSEVTAPLQEIIEEFPPKIKVYIIDPEFIMPGRDRSEDIGTFFAKPAMKEYRNYKTLDETKKNAQAFLKGYNFATHKMGADFNLIDLYPEGMTIDFHISSYVLYDTSEKILEKQLDLDSEEVQQNIELLRKILTEKPFSF